MTGPNLRIGYGSYSPDFSAAGDRRRLSAYARMRGLHYEHARLDQDYDLVYLTYNADLPGWLARKCREGNRFKLIFELVDSYLTERDSLRRRLKGLGRFVEGTDTRLSLDLQKSLRAICRAADAVVCSTKEQREMIAKLNPNVHVSLDYFGDELGPAPKRLFRRDGRLKLMWEGQAFTMHNLQSIRPTLNRLKDQVELHVVSDPSVPRYLGRFGTRSWSEILAGIECPVTFHRWSQSSLTEVAAQADVAIIPMDVSDPMIIGKPENKLVLLWQLGLPVLTGPTPSYSRAMAEAGLSMVCSTQEAWHAQLTRLAAAPADVLAALSEQVRHHAEARYSADRFCAVFDSALESVGLSQALRPHATQ